VPVAGEAVLPLAVERFAAAGIGLTELSLHLPSLDEVFLTLTGRPAEPGTSTTRTDPQEHAA